MAGVLVKLCGVMDGERKTADCAECRQLRKAVAELRELVRSQAQQIESQAQQIAAQTKQIASLQSQLEEQRRSGKRQAGPFSKGPPKADPQPPGRKPGDAYGQHQRRSIPDQIDETYDVPLPPKCPHCGGTHLADEVIHSQYQVEIPRTVIHREFLIHCGHCEDCGQRVQGRHELQTSDALGAAAVQLGPHLAASMAIMNKELGLTHGKVKRLLAMLFGLTIARSTSVRSMLRTSVRVQPALAEIKAEIRGSPVNKVDETGWKQSGLLKWLHVIVSPRAVLYQIGSRGREVLQSLIGLGYRGSLIHDGYAAYQAFWRATHQQCVAHLLKRCRELLDVATGGAVRFPRAVKELLQRGLAARDRYFAEELTAIGLKRIATGLTQELEGLVHPVKSHADNERFAKFLENHLDEVFPFLRHPDVVSATNNESESELRYNVIARKLSGGNRSDAGIAAQETLPSVIRTCRKLTRDPFEYLVQALTSITPVPLFPAGGR
jgi:transposase